MNDYSHPGQELKWANDSSSCYSERKNNSSEKKENEKIVVSGSYIKKMNRRRARERERERESERENEITGY